MASGPEPHAPLAVVLDTNVVLDLLVFEDPRVLPLAGALRAGTLVPLADARTLDELACVLAYPSFRLDAAAQRACLERYGAQVRRVPVEAGAPPPALPRCADRDDQKFLELAARGGAHWLVSKDKQLLQMGGGSRLPFLVLSPASAAARLQAPA